MSTDALRAQYEAYPYPARDPADERRRLVTGSPSHLDELNHYVFAGRLDFGRPLEVLVAGGGTGDATIMLAQQMADAGIPGRITHLDLSEAAMAVARKRAEVRGLTGIDFRRGSLFDLEGLGPFDYIDCCGVLHHLDDPAGGLRSLAAALKPGGGMGVMVYAPYGRTGVYPLQEALRPLAAGLPPAERVALARRLIQHLPPTNWLRANPFITDHAAADANLYDLLLHSRDRAYTVGELADLAAAAGLGVSALVNPNRYDPALWVKDPRILKRLDGLHWLERAAWAERVCGSLTKHIAYLVPAGREAEAVAVPDGPDVRPVLRGLEPEDIRAIRPDSVMDAELPGGIHKIALPRLARPILEQVDGRTSVGAIHERLQATLGRLPWDTFKAQFDQLYAGMAAAGLIHLRR